MKECTKFSNTQGASPSFNDYLQVAGAYLKQQASGSPDAYVLSSYYCGSGIGRDKATAVSQNDAFDGTDEGTGILSDGPFIVTFHSDKNPGNLEDNANAMGEGKNELGFSLDYRVTTSCPDLPFTDSN